jgi:predicted dinucleotide-binding enzyme
MSYAIIGFGNIGQALAEAIEADVICSGMEAPAIGRKSIRYWSSRPDRNVELVLRATSAAPP